MIQGRSAYNALAMATFWASPPDNWMPFSCTPNIVWISSGKVAKRFAKPLRFNTSRIASSFSLGSQVIFSFKVPANNAKSWKTTPNLFCKALNCFAVTGLPSMRIVPSLGSYKPHNNLISVVFPAPFKPTIAVFLWGSKVRLTSCNADWLLPGYA